MERVFKNAVLHANMLWFTCIGSNHIGRIDPFSANPGSSIVLFEHPQLQNPVAIKADSRGRIWFSLRNVNSIGSIDTLAEYPTASITIFSHKKIAGPAAIYITQNDQLFFVNSTNHSIGYVDCLADEPLKTIDSFPFPKPEANLRGWAEDKEGNLWVTVRNPNGLAKLTVSKRGKPDNVTFYECRGIGLPDGICLAKDKHLWFVLNDTNQIGKINPMTTDPISTLMVFDLPENSGGPFDIKPDAEQSLWFTNKTGHSIGRITLVPAY